MDQQAKQKVLIGVLAVLAIGAGSYYFLAGGDGPAQVVQNTGPVEQKARVVETEKVKERQTTRAADVRDSDEGPAERSERVQEERDDGERRTRRSGGPEKKSKVKNAPAA